MQVQNNLTHQRIILIIMGWSKGSWVIGIALLVLALVWWSKNDSETVDLKPYKLAIEQLKQQNDSLKKDNRLLDDKIIKNQLEADSLQELVAIKIIRIEKLKKVKNEKIKLIDTYSNDELLQFFAGVSSDSSAVEK